MGVVGQEYVRDCLVTKGPGALKEIGARAGLRDPRCAPLLGLLDQLGFSRCSPWSKTNLIQPNQPLLIQHHMPKSS